MNKMLLAVFGHYDSRGGTTGIPIKESTEEAIAAAIKEYNKQFGWEEDLESYRRDPSAWSWDPTEPASSPGEQDLLYVAELWYDGEMPDGDLEELGVVLLADETVPKYPEHSDNSKEWTLEANRVIAASAPTQLEFINLGKSRYESEEEYNEALEKEHGVPWEAWLQSKAQVVKEFSEVPSWNDDAFGFIIGTGLEE